MKRHLAMCLAAALAVPASLASTPLVVRTADADHQVAVENLSHVVFAADGSVSVHCLDGNKVEVAADKFVSLRFNTDRPAAAVSDITTDRSKEFTVSDGSITAPDAGIVLFDTSGREVARSATQTISTHQLTPGTYIARSGVSSLKVIVR